jgi:beta-glucanase (GH16 family)
LGADDKLPHINIFHYDGKRITLGNANKNLVDGVKIQGLNQGEFFIYTLIWTEKELRWFINNLEVYRTASNIPTEEMYLAFNSFITEKQRGSNGALEVDWVRVYKK